ncbi:hypothetical protein [Dictyobacter arantiisoli]|uniref:Uncharacterized protein n=1 Tax=Dictyobacter arantiisoli TaxID=2014874 RepID=A0A5A5T6Y1_9CHLR|nr:hypothetical protein [Dictyobacter arantiisoli]GCF07157.1 hypothetical protein KDI_07210 [Dictyobacter arantiisoli]
MAQAQIQTYATCTQVTFPDILYRYREALIQLGCTNQQVLEWITEITWPTSDDDSFGDIYAAPVRLTPPDTAGLECVGIEISLYGEAAVPSLKDLPTWVGFNLLIDTEQLPPGSTEVLFSAQVGRTIWQILQVLARNFTEIGAYLTDEWQDNQTWRIIAESAGDPWVFCLGVFPRQLASYFIEVPAGFKGTVVDAGFGFAEVNRWQKLPWETTQRVK